MNTAAKIVRVLDGVLNFVVVTLLLAAFLYGGYALVDTYFVYSGADSGSGVMQYKPVRRPPSAISADGTVSEEPTEEEAPNLGALLAINPDICGWITVDNTNIDYPIVQGDSNFTYINKDIFGEFSLSGSIFLDFGNASDFSDFYSLLYGHHMEYGAMFGDIDKFLSQEFMDLNHSGTLYVNGALYDIEFFCCVSADAYDSKIFNPVKVTEEEKAEFIGYISSIAGVSRGILPQTTDRIIGLSTCADASTNGRTILYGILTEVKSTTSQGGENSIE